MAYYDTLAQKWATLKGTTEERLAQLDALTVTKSRQPVPIDRVMDYLRSNALWLPIKAAAYAGSSQGAMAAVDLNDDLRMQTVDFDLPIVKAMLADIVKHSLLSAEQAAALDALGNVTGPWWQANGYTSPITLADLVSAGIVPRPDDSPVWLHVEEPANGQ